MNQLRFCHTRPCSPRGKLVPAEAGSGYLVGFSLDLIPDSCLHRIDKQQESKGESTVNSGSVDFGISILDGRFYSTDKLYFAESFRTALIYVTKV
jgi:hypothetical protein